MNLFNILSFFQFLSFLDFLLEFLDFSMKITNSQLIDSNSFGDEKFIERRHKETFAQVTFDRTDSGSDV